ncbi:hypothetical protein F4804DRAFT_308724 [Jackrogersella minutella]|nr:hypothetical protein F4804DRAFT_308724 [Jackrogersella minutella]
MATIWRRACAGCTKSKRQCTKAYPACRRCADKGIQCVYSPPRRIIHADAAPVASSSSTAIPPADASPVTHNSASNDAGSGDLDFAAMELTPAELTPAELLRGATGCRAPSPQPAFDDAGAVSSGTWFLAPESWVAEYTLPPSQRRPVHDYVLRHFVDSVQSWLKRWVTEGSSPLHHRQLYLEKMPRHIQDAHSAIAMYHMATASTDARATASRVLDDRVTQLLEAQALDASLGREPAVFDHLGRVQALLAYQTIRLFDGDVRMRAQAEALVPTLALWARQLLDCARLNLTRPARFLAGCAGSPDHGSTGDDDNHDGGGCSDEVLWRAWVLVESVRRSWSVANYVQEIYHYMKHRWTECPGRVTFTMRGGLWDAPTPYAWARACREKCPLFVPSSKTEMLFHERKPGDIDEFSSLIVELIYGVERMERWSEEAEGGGKTGRALTLECDVNGEEIGGCHGLSRPRMY